MDSYRFVPKGVVAVDVGQGQQRSGKGTRPIRKLYLLMRKVAASVFL